MKSLATLLAVLACLVLPVAAVSTWLQEQVVHTSAFVSAVAPLDRQPMVRDAAEQTISQAVLDKVGLDDSGTARDVVGPAVRQVVESDAFTSVWSTGTRAAHDQVIAVLSGDDDSLVADDGTVSIDLDDVAQPLGDALGSAASGVIPDDALSGVGFSLDLVDAAQLQRAQRAYSVVDAVGLWPAAAWLVLVVLALLVPRARRRALGVLGVGSLLAAALVAGGLVVGRGLLVDHAGAAGGDLVGAVWDALTHSLWIALIVVAVAAVVALVVSAAAGLRTGRRPA